VIAADVTGNQKAMFGGTGHFGGPQRANQVKEFSLSVEKTQCLPTNSDDVIGLA
jgi:hypothetical protein